MNNELDANTTLSHYRIISKIGEGGMGEVYLAQDTKLDRKVALKILPSDVAADRGRMNRFVQEAKSASALNHPNIITIYEIDETDSGHFIATEFIDGKTVRECLRKAPLTVSKALDVAVQVAAALAAAHQASIIHRDIKPENVMVRADGLVKVLDFGLAKLTTTGASDSEGATRIQSDTQPGMIMGTVAYMSPEQARGKVVDVRTDVWSLGVLLYEMLSRRPPFRGETASDTLANILHREPDTLNIGALPTDLAKIIDRMLAKELEARYATVADAISDLKSLQKRIEYDSELQQTVLRSSAEAHTETIAAATASKSPNQTAVDSASSRTDEGFWVAVLPFKYPGSNSELATLAEGLSEDVVTGLSRFPFLRVIARGSTSRFADASGDVRAIGIELGARYVIEASLRQAGTMLRVTVQLLDAITGAHLWAETYNRDLKQSDFFTVQDEISDRIVATVADGYGVLVSSMAATIEEKRETEMTACDWLLRQCRYRQLLTPEEHARMREGLERFVEREPKHAEPWACLAQLYVDEFVFKFNQRPDSLDRALVAARRSVDLNRTFQYGYQMLAQVHFFRRDIPAFRTAAEKAMSLNPRDTDTLAIMGLMLVHIAEFERGANIVRRAMDLNPNHAGWYHFAVIWEHLHKGDYEKALARINRVNMPGLFWQPLTVASVCGLLGRPTEAAAAVQELRKLDPDFELHVREYIEVWHYSSGLMDRILEGLMKAGVEIANDAGTPLPSLGITASGEGPTQEGFWVAVLPFKYRGSNAELEELAEGLTEDIVTGLSRFSYLRVIARSSTLRYVSESGDVRVIGNELGARYIIEGSLRVAGSVLRVSVQLVDATSGSHIWAETYNRTFTPEQLFALQDDLVPTIVSTVADMHGVLPRSMSEAVRLKSADQMSPYEALLYSFGYNERFTTDALAEARTCLERAVQQAPGNADCWAMLSLMYSNEYGHWHIHKPDSAEKALKAARTAVQLAPLHSLPYYALAQALFFRKEFPAFRVAAERAVSLSPMDGATAAFMGLLIAYSGDWERGCVLAEQGLQLNPNHPGWYAYTAWHDAYRKKDYQTALDLALKLNAPDNFYTHAVLAMCYAQLGQMEAARKAIRDLLALKPDYPQIARQLHAKWIQPDLVEELMEGLRKAGLVVADDEDQATPKALTSASNETRSDEGFWVAVLPFKFTGSNTEVATLAEGLSEEIVTGLSRFSYLRVISHSSTLRYAKETDDVRDVGKTLGARYVMEGSLRVAGSSLRISVQLVDAVTGAHLWAETYDRQFRAEEVFVLQDDLVPRIVSTVADVNGVLPRSMSEVVCAKNPDELSPHEAVLRSFRYFDRVTPEELTGAQSCLEIAVQKAPANADAWAMLALLFAQDYGQGFNIHPDALNSGAMAAQRAVETGPSNHLAHFSLAQARFFQKEIQSFRNAAERAVALNPMDANSLAFIGELFTYVGDSERGLALASRAKQINPNHPGWFWYADFFHAYRQGDYRGALDLILKTNLPGHWGMHAGIAACAGHLGDKDLAAKSVRDLLTLRPDYGATVHKTLAKWFDPELCEQLLDGLRKAGLKIDDEAES